MTAKPVNRFAVDDFPAALRRRFKANAALTGLSMQRAAIIAIEDWCWRLEGARRMEVTDCEITEDEGES